MSYKAEVIADNSGKWAGNQLAFATKDEAEAYARDLAGRWLAVQNHRVVESDQPVNTRWDAVLGQQAVPEPAPAPVQAAPEETAKEEPELVIPTAVLTIIGPSVQDWGIIPTFLDNKDPRPAKEQINQHYSGGWMKFDGFTFDPVTFDLTYPDDPPMQPLSAMLFRRECLLMYEGEFVVIVQPDGSWEAARLD